MPRFLDTSSMLLRSAYLTLHRRFNAHFKSHGVTADQFVVLSLLGEHGGCTQRELAGLSASDANTISAMLRRLERKGLVVRKDHPGDERAFTLQLTASGRALRALCEQTSRPLHARLESCIPPGERLRLATALTAIREIMNEAGPPAASARELRRRTTAAA